MVAQRFNNRFCRVLRRALPGLLLAAAPVLAQPVAGGGAGQRQADAERSLELPPPKADAFFQLLAPEHVKVLVSRRPTGVQVNGTQREVEALAALAALITRSQGTDFSSDNAALAELRKTWDTKETYALPAASADDLFRLLAFNDVPVFVSHATGGVTVEASRADQQIIADVVRIVRGEALEKAPPPAKADRPGPPTAPKARRNQDADGKKLGALERRVIELEERVAALEALARELHGEEHGHAHAHDAPEGAVAPPAPPAPKAPVSPNLIDRRYKLPPHHAENLFALFAPADITDVIVSREGNQLKIRASEQDHQLIARLVKLLNRGQQKRAEAAPDTVDSNG